MFQDVSNMFHHVSQSFDHYDHWLSLGRSQLGFLAGRLPQPFARARRFGFWIVSKQLCDLPISEMGLSRNEVFTMAYPNFLAVQLETMDFKRKQLISAGFHQPSEAGHRMSWPWMQEWSPVSFSQTKTRNPKESGIFGVKEVPAEGWSDVVLMVYTTHSWQK